MAADLRLERAARRIRKSRSRALDATMHVFEMFQDLYDLHCPMINLSEEGFSIESALALAMDVTFYFSVDIPGKGVVEGSARPHWVRPARPGRSDVYGCRILTLTDEGTRIVREYVGEPAA